MRTLRAMATLARSFMTSLRGQEVQHFNVVDYDERVPKKLVSDLDEEGIDSNGGLNDHHHKRYVLHE
jgi:hypothetical protein